MRLIPLGTNGFIPTFGRHTMSYLVLRERQAILLDGGTGIGRLIEPAVREAVRGYERLDVVLSHYHLDHVIGLTFLSGVWTGPVRIFGPAPPLVDARPEDALGFIGPPWFPSRLLDTPGVEVVPVTKTEWELEGVPVRMRRQKHPGGSVGIRLGDALAYTTDTVIDPGAEPLLHGVGLLLHEVWLTDAEAAVEAPEKSGHSAAGQVVELALAAGVKRLMPVHHHPKRTDAELRRLVQEMRRSGLEVILAVEGEAYLLGAGAGA